MIIFSRFLSLFLGDLLFIIGLRNIKIENSQLQADPYYDKLVWFMIHLKNSIPDEF